MIGMMSCKSRRTCYSLCNWISPYRVRNGIRAGTVNISEDYFLRCFYPYGKGDPDNVEKGFLRSGLLVKVCSTIHTLYLLIYLYTRHILIFSYHPPHLNPLMMKMKMALQENRSISQTRRGKQQSVMLQASSAWMAKWLHVQLLTQPFWYVNLKSLFPSSFINALPHSWPSTWLTLVTGWRSIIISIFVHCMHWLLIFLRLHVVCQHKNVLGLYSNGGARTWFHTSPNFMPFRLSFHFFRQTNFSSS